MSTVTGPPGAASLVPELSIPLSCAAGNLFLPTDLSSLGAGLRLAQGSSPYLQNRATGHLHGGNAPWISDGTPHQWTIRAGDWNNTSYQRGGSVQFVPEMWFVNGQVVPQCSASATANCSDPTSTRLPAGASNEPGPGTLTFYYTNRQSACLLFFHDHAYGTTRLNVYAGEASAFVIRNNAELELINTNVSGYLRRRCGLGGRDTGGRDPSRGRSWLTCWLWFGRYANYGALPGQLTERRTCAVKSLKQAHFFRAFERIGRK